MALFLRSRISPVIARLSIRGYSKTDQIEEKGIKKSVFISQSKDIYANLALEQWLFKNFDFNNHHVMMLWQSDPCVVIGAHQNPWLETNHCELNHHNENEIKLARRFNNGGAVYQDNGTLNMTFFSPQHRYNSRNDMEIISRGIFREFGFKTDINTAENLILRNNKQISNKAVNIGHVNSYHNCSLMVKVNKIDENLMLQKQEVDIKTNVIQPVNNLKKMNLCEENPHISVESVLKAVGWEFLRTKALSIKDGGLEQANSQNGFHLINPTDGWFPGLKQIRDNLTSWEWCYGATPKFNISRTFTVPGGLINHNTGASTHLKVTMTVEHGKISGITLFVPYGLNSLGFTGEAKVIHNLKGKRFSIDVFEDLEQSLDCLLDDRDRFVTECLKQVMTCA